MSFVQKWARAGLTTHPSQLKDLAAHAKAHAHAERMRKMQPRLKSATLSRDVSGSASTRVPSRRDVSRRVLGRDVEAQFVKDRSAPLGAGGMGWGRMGAVVDKPVATSGFGPVSTSRSALISAPVSTLISGRKSTPANAPTSTPTSTPASTPAYDTTNHKSTISTRQTLHEVSIEQTQAKENPAFSHLPPTAVLIATAKALCSYVSKLPFFTTNERPVTISATVAADTNVPPTPAAGAIVADGELSVAPNGDFSPRFPLTDEVLAYVAGSGAVQGAFDASRSTSSRRGGRSCDDDGDLSSTPADSLFEDDKNSSASGDVGSVTTLSDTGFSESVTGSCTGREEKQASIGESSGEMSAGLFMTPESKVLDGVPAYTSSDSQGGNNSQPQDFTRKVDTCLEEKAQEDSAPPKECDIDATKTSISKIEETKDSEQETEADSEEDSSDSEEEDVEIIIHPSANSPFHPLVPQFPSYNHPSHNSVLAYQHMGTLSLPPVPQYLTLFNYYARKRLDPSLTAAIRAYLHSQAERFAARIKRHCIFATQRTIPKMRRSAQHTVQYLTEQERICTEALALVRDFEQHVLQRPPPAAKFTACRAFKAGACSDAYCIFDHDFGSTPCRDNVIPGMVCLTRDCHFKHASPSWTPASGGVPENLGEILCENGPVGTDPKWKKCCANINKGAGCRWGTGCRYSHALVGVACPEYAASGRCPRVRCPLKHGVRQGIAFSGSKHSSDSGEGDSRPQTPAKQAPGQSSLSSSSNTPPTGSKRARDPESPEDSHESERPHRRRRTAPAPRIIHHPDPRTQRQTQQNPTSPRAAHSEMPTQTAAPSPDAALTGLDSPSSIALDDGDPMDIDHEGFHIKGAAGEDQMDIDPVYW